MPNYIVNKYRGLFLRAKELYADKNYKEAKELLLIVVEKDVANFEASYLLAEICFNGLDGEYDYYLAFKNYLYTASNDYKSSFFNVGLCYFEEKGTLKDYSQALVWFERAAKSGESKAYYFLGYIYLNGLSVSKDDSKALMWFIKAAKNNDTNAQLEAAKIYEEKKEYYAAATLYLAASKNGNALAIEKMGDYYAKGNGIDQSKDLAIDFYERAKKLGSKSAELKIIELQNNEETEEEILKKNVEIYIKNAKEGSAKAAKMLGDSYYYGKGINQDYFMAYNWWNKAALLGDVDSMVVLAEFLIAPQTDRVERDLATAKYWLLKAAENGHVEAMYKLGYALENATFFNEANFEDAYKWYELAAKKGHLGAKEALKKFKKDFSGKVKIKNKFKST